MNDRNYWRRRAEQLEREWQGRCRSEVEKELAAHYRAALTEIADDIAALFGRFSRENSLGYLEARRLIRGAEFKAWRMSLEEYVAAAAADSAILKELNTLAMRSRISRLEKLYSETLVELQKLGERSEAAIGDFLKTAGRERYLQGLYDLGAVGKLAIPVSKLNPANLEKTLAARWEGGNYSTRIWKNTTKLAKTLKATISQGLHRGLSIDKMSKAVDKEMRAGYKNAERLVRTEMNFVQTRMAADSMSAAGLDEYEFVAVLDHRTTQRCQALDGTTHLIEEMQQGANAPPMHPRCRSTITATFSETLKGGTRTARVGGKSIRVPRDMKYADFKAVYIDKTTTLKEWQEKRAERNSSSGGQDILSKLANNEIVIPVGTRAAHRGDKDLASEFKGTPPIIIGKVSDLSPEAVRRALLDFERRIADEKVENAIIIAANGDVYHCSGGFDGIAKEYFDELGDKLNGASATHNHPPVPKNEHTFSSEDWSLFVDFDMSVLRGIDENYVYELNRNSEEVDFEAVDIGELEKFNRGTFADSHKYVSFQALINGVGYRRQNRE